MPERTHYTTDHDAIRAWARRHGARPAIARDTIASRNLDQLALVLPGERAGENVRFIPWDEFLEYFDSSNMVLVYQERPEPRKTVPPSRLHMLVPAPAITELRARKAALRPRPALPAPGRRSVAGRDRSMPELMPGGRATRRGRATMDEENARPRSTRAERRRTRATPEYRARNTRSAPTRKR